MDRTAIPRPVGTALAILGSLAATAAAPARQGGLSMIEPPAPPPLPPAPIWERLLLENPWPLAIILAAGAIVAFVSMRHRAPPRHTAAAVAGLALAAVGVLVLASLVETAREQMRHQTFELISAAARASVTDTGTLLAPDATLFPPGGGAALDRDDILTRVERDLGGAWRLREWAVLECEASVSGDTGRTQVKVRATPEAAGFPNISWWRLGWRRDPPGPWRVISIEPVSVTREVENQLR